MFDRAYVSPVRFQSAACCYNKQASPTSSAMSSPMHSGKIVRPQGSGRDADLTAAGEALFDDLTLLAERICAAPIAALSLVQGKQQWFKPRGAVSAAETPRAIALCSETILARVRSQNHRPLLQTPDPLARIRELLSSREPFYRKADVIVGTEMRSIKDVAHHVLHQFRMATAAPSHHERDHFPS